MVACVIAFLRILSTICSSTLYANTYAIIHNGYYFVLILDKEWRPYISKTDFHHIVPLSTQAISILERIKLLTGAGQYVFPSSKATTTLKISANAC